MSKSKNKEVQPSGESRATLIAQRRLYSGPLPPPESFEAYNLIVPGAAERILAMAEREVLHRHDIEKSVIKHSTSIEDKGLYLSTLIMVIAILGGIYLVAIDRPVEGVTALVLGILTSVAPYFLKFKHRADNDE